MFKKYASALLQSTISLSIILSYFFYDYLPNSAYFERFFIINLLLCVLLFLTIIYAFTKNKNKNKIKLSIYIYDIFLLFLIIYLLVNNFLNEKIFDPLNFVTILCILVISFSSRFAAEDDSLPKKIFITSCLALSFILVCHGLLQLVGILPSFSFLSQTTGFYANPAPYAALIALTSPLVFSIVNGKNRLICNDLIINIAILVAVLSIVILPFTHSRAAILSAALGIGFVFVWQSNFLNWIQKKTLFKRISTYFAILLSLIVLIICLYNIRPNSAKGRLLIWKISANMVDEDFITGKGWGYFKNFYNKYQSSYFSESQNMDEKLLSSNSIYAFNEYIELSIEQGIIGLLGFVALLVLAFIRIRSSCDTKKPKSRNVLYSEVTGLQGSLVSGVVFCFFSYPLEDPLFTIVFFLMIAVTAYSLNNKPILLLKKNYNKSILFFIPIFVVITSIKLFSWSRHMLCAYREWTSNRNELVSVPQLEELKKHLHYERMFHLDLARCYTYKDDNAKAIKILEDAKELYYDPNIYLNLGILYLESKQLKKAEQCFIEVINCVPYMLTPKSYLMNLYLKVNNIKKAKQVAQQIKITPEKVPSYTTSKIKKEASLVLDQINE